MPIRVLHITPHGTPAYGVSPYSNSLLQALKDTAQASDKVELLDYQSAYPTILYPAHLPRRKRRTGIHWAKPWSWNLEFNKYDIIHTQYWTRATLPHLLWIIKRANASGTKTVLTMHNLKPHERTRFLSGLEAYILGSVSALVTHIPCSKLSSHMGSRHWIIPHGVEIRDKNSLPRHGILESLLNLDKKFILFFGNIRPYKGLEDLLVAWKSIHRDFPEYMLVVAGRFWKAGNIINRVTKLKAGIADSNINLQKVMDSIPSNSIKLLNRYVSDTELDVLCNACDLAVFPYKSFDAQSGAACRVSSFGKRVLVSRVGGLPNIVYDEKYTFEPGDTRTLANKLRTMLSSPKNIVQEEERAQLQHISQFSWANIAQSHWKMYRALLGLRH